LNVAWNLIDIEEILREAQHRWLRPAEICEILRNYRKFELTPNPPVRPPGIAYIFRSFKGISLIIAIAMVQNIGMFHSLEFTFSFYVYNGETEKVMIDGVLL
jgi:hypothetical protein